MPSFPGHGSERRAERSPPAATRGAAETAQMHRGAPGAAALPARPRSASGPGTRCCCRSAAGAAPAWGLPVRGRAVPSWPRPAARWERGPPGEAHGTGCRGRGSARAPSPARVPPGWDRGLGGRHPGSVRLCAARRPVPVCSARGGFAGRGGSPARPGSARLGSPWCRGRRCPSWRTRCWRRCCSRRRRSPCRGSACPTLPWGADEEKKRQCVFKGKDPQRDCHNYIKMLLQLNSTHLYTCGTCAFSPTCAYINVQHFTLERDALGRVLLEDGKGRCPFDPEYRSTAVMVDGELYAGTVSNFQGNEPTIYRSQESRISLKTENSLSWLQDPVFVGSAFLQESLPAGNPDGDDDKVYFFFSETGKEFDYFENTIVSRIARVCKGDQGGERVLQRRWTTFLKAQLLCSHPEDGFPFNVLQDVFVLTPGEQRWRETLFYGVFTSQWNKGGLGSSAVCAFPMHSVQKAFGGLYKEVNRETQQWYTDTSPVPEPRPGTCITSHTRHLKINSSLQMPDRVLNFVKDHFLMDSPVRSQPLLLQSRLRYQQIGVHRVQGLRGTYDVLFLGTDDGRLHKAVRVNHRVHIIEEIRLFPTGQPILQLLLDHEQGLVYAASYTAVAQVPFSNCSLYRSCGECVLARDPFCAWSHGACRSTAPHPPAHPQLWAQDIEGAETERLCQPANVSQPRPRVLLPPASGTPCQRIQLPPNAVQPLPCRLLSNLASRRWLHNGTPVNASYLVLPEGALILVGSPERAGTYECWSLEEGFRKLMASYCVAVQEPGGRGFTAPETVSTSRSTSAVGSIAARLDGKTYWTEFLVMSGLFAAAMLVLILFLLHRHCDGVKALVEPGDAGRHQKAPRKPVESLPLNGSNLPNAAPEHKGYQALQDNYIVSTPVHEPPGTTRAFSESEKRPLHVRDSFVEVSPACQRPRVRLGSEIQDSVV
ncbi:semaphorin-4B isoform X3 [Gallus gallus]|uniref:semaphorin-4B isoform X3 n=1 Tax=Gallus gallus TaxID=9031 RepID=UPI000D63FD5E|nr:semaphorin-4B isoform X3 [Gallus gallus]|eukprot:XP_025009815.1 semaphorin-4B isoform X2 [Gallus gallus]